MSLSRIASRYAKSLIDFAQEQNKLDRVHEDILNLQVACANSDFLSLCKSPIIQSSKKEKVYKALFENIFDPISFGFFTLLIRKGREIYMPEVVQEFINQYKAIRKQTTVTLTTASTLDTNLVKDILAKLKSSTDTHDNIDLLTKVNSELIGGFVLEFDDKLYDASVANQLRLMKKSLSNNEALKTI